MGHWAISYGYIPHRDRRGENYYRSIVMVDGLQRILKRKVKRATMAEIYGMKVAKRYTRWCEDAAAATESKKS